MPGMMQQIDDIFYDVDTGKQYYWAGDHYEYLPPQPEPPTGGGGGSTPPPPIPGNEPPKPKKRNPKGGGNDEGDKGDKKQSSDDEEKDGKDSSENEGEDKDNKDGQNGKGNQGNEDEDQNKGGGGNQDDEEGDDGYGDEEGDETPDEFAQRIAKIRKLLSDPEWQEAGVTEVVQAVQKDRKVKAKKERERLKAGSPIMQFTESLNDFIRNQIKTGKGTSWSKINKKYAHSGIIKPGKTRRTQQHIPLISVYWDQSGSWDENDIKVGQQALNTLKKYEDDKKIIIEPFYFSNHIYDTAEAARRDGGTAAGKELIEHINNPSEHIGNRKPDNVIVMTDSDFDSWDEITGAPNIKVTGAVWFLFRNDESKRLQQHLKGETLTKKFMIEN